MWSVCPWKTTSFPPLQQPVLHVSHYNFANVVTWRSIKLCWWNNGLHICIKCTITQKPGMEMAATFPRGQKLIESSLTICRMQFGQHLTRCSVNSKIIAVSILMAKCVCAKYWWLNKWWKFYRRQFQMDSCEWYISYFESNFIEACWDLVQNIDVKLNQLLLDTKSIQWAYAAIIYQRRDRKSH